MTVLDEDAYFGRLPAAGGRTGRIGTVRSKGVRRRITVPSLSSAAKSHAGDLGNPQMFQDTHPHLFNIAGPKHSCADKALRVLSRAKAPRLYGARLDKNGRSKAVEIVRRFRCT